MLPSDLQQRLLDVIISRYQRRSDAVEDLCRILNMTKDPIYRRLRGDTVLTPQELALLAQHYNLSLDRLVFGQSTKLMCTFSPLNKKIQDFGEYLTEFISDFERIRRLPNGHMFSASAEIPVLTCAYFPELLGFKLYVWGRTTWDFEYLRNRPFAFDLITEPVRRQMKQLEADYNTINGTEMLSINTVDMTLSQIEYQVYSNGFKDPNEALQLCEILIKWTEHLKNMATSGRKFSPGYQASERSAAVNLYHNEIFYTNNIAYVESDLGPVTYFTFNGPNFMRTTDERFCTFTGDWFRQVMSKSNPMSQVSERTREWFFRELIKKIERVKQRIALHIAEEA